jgi:plastocyanin
MLIKRLAPAAIVGALALTLVACGDDDDASSATTASAAATTVASPETTMDHSTMAMDGATVAIEGIDYRFDQMPTEVKAGTKFTFENTSTKEFHEMVALRIPDSETRSVQELTQLSEAETDALFADVEPAFVFVAPPGEEGMPVVGDGTITEPGRYAVICAIPVGADPAKVMEAMQTESSGPPDLGDGAPHFVNGMFAELNVTA